MNRSTNILAAALIATAMLWIGSPAAAAPISSPLGLQSAVGASVQTVQYRRGYRGGRRGGAGVIPGIAGAIIGGAIIGATQPYGPYYGYPYGYGPYGYGPGYVVVAPPYAGSAVAYCQQRFRSYDPVSGTYLGLDGQRHSCP